MKKLIALPSAILSLAAVVSLTGCGSGSSSVEPLQTTAFATSVNEGNSRAIRVSWTPVETPASGSRIIEYDILRRSSADPDNPVVVGATDINTRTFIDSEAERTVTYNAVVPTPDNQEIIQFVTQHVPALATGDYTYSVQAVFDDYRKNNLTGITPQMDTLYGHVSRGKDTASVHFE